MKLEIVFDTDASLCLKHVMLVVGRPKQDHRTPYIYT